MYRALILLVLLSACERSRPPGPSREHALELLGHVIVLKASAQIYEYRDVVKEALSIDGVTSARPMVMCDGTASSTTKQPVPVVLKAIAATGVSPGLERLSVSGSFESLRQKRSVILAAGLARTLNVTVGDEVTLIPTLDFAVAFRPNTGSTFRVTGIFHVDVERFEQQLAFVELGAMQELLGGDFATGVELRVSDIDRATAIADQLEERLGGPPYQAQSWREINPDL